MSFLDGFWSNSDAFSNTLCMEFLDMFFCAVGVKKTHPCPLGQIIWLLDIAILLVVIVVAAALIVAVFVLLSVRFLQSL